MQKNEDKEKNKEIPLFWSGTIDKYFYTQTQSLDEVFHKNET